MRRHPDTDPFPIQGEHGREYCGVESGSTIPMWLAELAYEQYAKCYGRSQTLERLGERGGFGRIELVDLLRGGRGNGERCEDMKGEE